MPETRLATAPLSERKAEELLTAALRGRGGALTRADAAAATGLPLDQTDAALKALTARYRSHLAVTEEGELLYRFDPALVPRDRLPLRERARAVGQALYRGFAFAFKVWIAVTLVVYVLAFAAMLIALLFARSNDRDDRRRGGDGFGFPWLLWWMMPDWAPPDVQRRLGRTRDGRPRKRFYKSVFDFVFGPDGQPVELRGAEKQVASYLRANGGRMTTTDLVALTGLSYADAEQEMTRLLAAWDGDPEVTDDGTIVYSFPSLRRTSGELADGRYQYAWQEERALAPFTGNSDGANTAVVAMNGFNLVGGLLIAPAFLLRYGIHAPWLSDLLTWYPIAFSSMFFAVPGARWLKRRGAQGRLVREQARAALVGAVIERKGAAATPEELVAAAAPRLPGLPAERVRRELERLLRDLDGDVQSDEGGAMRYAFPRVAEELAASQRARALAPLAEADPGAVVFRSDDEPAALPPRRTN